MNAEKPDDGHRAVRGLRDYELTEPSNIEANPPRPRLSTTVCGRIIRMRASTQNGRAESPRTAASGISVESRAIPVSFDVLGPSNDAADLLAVERCGRGLTSRLRAAYFRVSFQQAVVLVLVVEPSLLAPCARRRLRRSA